MKKLYTFDNYIKLNENKSSVINVEKLQSVAHSIETLCNGEYGQTYFNPDTNHIAICLGDANPFDEEYLEQFILDSITDYKNRDNISLEIDYEWVPGIECAHVYNSKKGIFILR